MRYDKCFAYRPFVPGHLFAEMHRFSRGMTVMRPSHPVYGWVWKCECGEERKINGTVQEARRTWRSHRILHPVRRQAHNA
jgi:hypothetical protein